VFFTGIHNLALVYVLVFIIQLLCMYLFLSFSSCVCTCFYHVYYNWIRPCERLTMNTVNEACSLCDRWFNDIGVSTDCYV